MPNGHLDVSKLGSEWVSVGSPNHEFSALPAPAAHHCSRCGGARAGAQHVATSRVRIAFVNALTDERVKHHSPTIRNPKQDKCKHQAAYESWCGTCGKRAF